jgi:hypothetical protein
MPLHIGGLTAKLKKKFQDVADGRTTRNYSLLRGGIGYQPHILHDIAKGKISTIQCKIFVAPSLTRYPS